MKNKIEKFIKLTNTVNYQPVFNNEEMQEDYLDRFLEDGKALKIARRVNKYNEINNTNYKVGLHNEPTLGWEEEDEFHYIIDESGLYQDTNKFYIPLLERALVERNKRLLDRLIEKVSMDDYEEDTSFKI